MDPPLFSLVRAASLYYPDQVSVSVLEFLALVAPEEAGVVRDQFYRWLPDLWCD